jgi:HlyD family secretion protein
LCCLLAAAASPSAADHVGALGRIRPAGGIVHLTGPPGETIVRIEVDAGDMIEKGDVLVIFSGRDLLESDVNLAKLALREADELGQRAILLQAQKVKLAEQDFSFAKVHLERFQKVDGESLSAEEMHMRRYRYETAELQLDIARRELERLKLENELRKERSRQQLALARQRWDASILKAPSDGIVLEVVQTVGESVGARPVLRMAPLEQMAVVAEIFEGDVMKVAPGMKATITGSAFPETLTGTVKSIGRIINPQNKVAEATILLDESEPASRLINMEVNVSIQLKPDASQ